MAGRREVFERTRFRDGNRSSASREQNVGDSMHRINNSGNIPTETRTEPSTIAARSFKDEENGNRSMHFSSARMQGNATNPTIDYQDLAHQPLINQLVSSQHSQGHQIQGPPARDQNQNTQARSVSQDLRGLIPPREIDILPPDGDADSVANYRRMAVCQETDDALGQRTKMRVYMKRF